jgi:hypothetical protein
MTVEEPKAVVGVLLTWVLILAGVGAFWWGVYHVWLAR